MRAERHTIETPMAQMICRKGALVKLQAKLMMVKVRAMKMVPIKPPCPSWEEV